MSRDQFNQDLDGSAASMSIIDEIQRDPLLVYRVSRDLQEEQGVIDPNVSQQQHGASSCFPTIHPGTDEFGTKQW